MQTVKNTIIVIDTDSDFPDTFRKQMDSEYYPENPYTIYHVAPDTSLNKEQMLKKCIEGLAKVKTTNEIIAFFVDLNLRENTKDHLGIDIGMHVRTSYPFLPIFSVTNKYSNELDFDNMSKASLEDFDGVFTKSFIGGGKFNRERFIEIIEKAKVKREEKKSLINCKKNKKLNSVNNNYDVAILTALYEDEFQNVIKAIDANWRFDKIKDDTKVYFTAEVKNCKNKKIRIIATSQSSTGLVDAAVFATEIITKFKPKYLIMPGVLGGKPKAKPRSKKSDGIDIGDIVIGIKLFMLGKGKRTDAGVKPELESFEVDTKIIHLLRINQESIIDYVRANVTKKDSPIPLNLHFSPIACSNSVINEKGFFETNVTSIERKTIAIEMESFSVARACKIANNGNTKAIVIKSVMDRIIGKNDNGKSLASQTSAVALQYIILNILEF